MTERDIYAVEGTGHWRTRQTGDWELLRYILVPPNPIFGGLIPPPVLLPFEPVFGDAVRQAVNDAIRFFVDGDVPPQQFPPIFGLRGYSAVH